MNWTIRSLRRAPAALRTPTSTARREARAVIRVTKLIAAMSTIRPPSAARPASTRGSATSRRDQAPADWPGLKCRSASGVRRKSKDDTLALAPGYRLRAKSARRARTAAAEAPGFSRT